MNSAAAQNLVSPLQYSAMLKLYSTTKDDPPTSTSFNEPAKSELGSRKASSGSGGSASGGGPSNGAIKKKSSFEGKEYSRLSTSEKDARPEPETVFSSEDSDIQESSQQQQPQKSGQSSAFRWDGTKLGDRASGIVRAETNEISEKSKSEVPKKSENSTS